MPVQILEDVRRRLRARTGGAKLTPLPTRLERVKAKFAKWLYMPDPLVLDFVFGTVFANWLQGDPVWGGIVAASGDLKTEVLRSLVHARIFHLSNLTPKALISGLGKEMCAGNEPSLLPRLDGKILVVKDLTPLISGPSETLHSILGQLRDAYDGSAAMAFGTGETKTFKSRFGMLFGVTPIIESCWPVMAALGERFVYYRSAPAERMLKVEAAMRNANQRELMRTELEDAAQLVLDQPAPPAILVPAEIQSKIAHMADFVAIARTPVKRAGRTEEVLAEPAAEVGTRLAGQLIQLARGIAAARGSSVCKGSVLEVIRRVATSGIPSIRMRIIRELARTQSWLSSDALGSRLRLGSGTVKRTAEDLWSLGLLERAGGAGNAYKWRQSKLTQERLCESELLKS